ncbi:MAG: DNA polymerase III subunit delta [Spirochaetia bacterium]
MSKASPKARIFLLLGPEHGEKFEYLDALRRKISSMVGEAPEEHKLYSFESSIREAVSLLQSPSLFSSHTLVRVLGAEQYKRVEDVKVLIDYAAHPAENGTLVLESDAPGIEKKIEALVIPERKKIFWEMFDNQKHGYVVGYFRKKGVAIDHEAAELLLELVENGSDELRREADRLCLIFGKGSRIAAEDVERYIFHSKEENVFTLFEQIVAGDLERALDILQQLQLAGTGQANQILAGLTWQWRNLHAVRCAVDRGMSAPEAAAASGVRGKRNQKLYAAAAQAMDTSAVERGLEAAGELTVELRSTRPAVHYGLLSDFVFRLTVGRGESARP